MLKPVIGAIALLACTTAYARAPEATDPSLAPWFKSLSNPALGLSCCDTADGHILRDSEWRVAGNGYQVLINGQWRNVPPEAVLEQVPNPAGGAVVFYSPISAAYIYCFVRPAEG